MQELSVVLVSLSSAGRMTTEWLNPEPVQLKTALTSFVLRATQICTECNSKLEVTGVPPVPSYLFYVAEESLPPERCTTALACILSAIFPKASADRGVLLATTKRKFLRLTAPISYL